LPLDLVSHGIGPLGVLQRRGPQLDLAVLARVEVQGELPGLPVPAGRAAHGAGRLATQARRRRVEGGDLRLDRLLIAGAGFHGGAPLDGQRQVELHVAQRRFDLAVFDLGGAEDAQDGAVLLLFVVGGAEGGAGEKRRDQGEYRVPSTEYRVLSTQRHAPGTRYSVLVD